MHVQELTTVDEHETVLVQGKSPPSCGECCESALIPVEASGAEGGGEETHVGKCYVCARMPYRIPAPTYSLMWGNQDALAFENGFFDVTIRAQHVQIETVTIDRETAQEVAALCTQKCKVLRQKLSACGLLQAGDQNFTGTTASARVVAPFDSSELDLGALIGMGGFSTVYEVEGFRPDPHLSSGVTYGEQAAREYLTSHATYKPTKAHGTNTLSETNLGESSSSSSKPRFLLRKEKALPRYALKRLRPTLAERDLEKFKKAAMDLVLEGQLLLALDHPNIISLRGWSYYGPDAFRSCKYIDYFLIMDLLPEQLEDRIYMWRQSLRKYRTRSALPWVRKKYQNKIHDQLLKRIQAAYDIAGGLEYMHDRRLVNRDVKVANIGFDVRGDIKIFDLGLSRLLPPESEKLSNGSYAMTCVGTYHYMAPEIRKRECYDLSVDTYSFGVVLWEILALSSPRDTKVLCRSKDLPICLCWPDHIQQLVASCLSADPRDRPDMSEIRQVLRQPLFAQDGLRPPVVERACMRRRSTFRLDLSALPSIAQPAEGSGESKTSHCSSFLMNESSTSLFNSSL